MNKEFMILPDNTIAITDEQGHISKRINENNNTEEMLLAENKLEITEKNLEKLKQDLQNKEGLIHLAKYMWVALIPIVALSTVAGFGYGILLATDFIANGIYFASLGFNIGLFLALISSIYMGVSATVAKRKIKRLKNAISKAEDLKKEYEQELSKTKERQQNSLGQTLTINEPISLEDKTIATKKAINNELNEAYLIKEKHKTKKLTREKNNKY